MSLHSPVILLSLKNGKEMLWEREGRKLGLERKVVSMIEDY